MSAQGRWNHEHLAQLAGLYGVETAYYDVSGRERVAPQDVLGEVLSLLGADLGPGSDAEDAVRVRERELARRVLEPVTVLWGEEQGVPKGAVFVRLPRPTAPSLELDLTLEDGETRGWSARTDELGLVDAGETGGLPWTLLRLDLPGPLPLGYHHLRVTAGRESHERLIIVAPRRAYGADGPRHDWGVFAPTYALRSKRNWGVGDLRDLKDLTVWAGRRGAGVVGTLPLLAAFLDEPFDPSPYSPVSRLFWNELFLDVEAVPELSSSGAAGAVLADPSWRRALADARTGDLVDHRTAMAVKRAVLEPMSQRLLNGPESRLDAFRRFLADRPDVEEYARFRAAADRHRAPWWHWPMPAQDGRLDRTDFDADDAQYHRYVQWLMETQVAGLADAAEGCSLYLDLPLGVNAAGYDVWRYRDLFALRTLTGAPPDAFFPSGQDWGFPPLHPEALRAEGYRYLIAALRHQLSHAGIVRIDHVMGLHRLYWIPEGRPAGEGVYVRYPAEELYAVLCLESQRAECVLVGEDLGTVPPEVGPALAEHGIHGMYVLQYLANPTPEAALPAVPGGTMASLNTHDMPTFAAFWTGEEIFDRVANGNLSPDAVPAEQETRAATRRAIVRALAERGRASDDPDDIQAALRGLLAFLGTGDADDVIVALEDLWLERLPQNVPGTSFELPNWRRRLRYSLEDLATLPEVYDLLATLDRERRRVRATLPPADAAAEPLPHVTRLSDQDLYLFNEGTHLRLYDKLGAHPLVVDGTEGTYFAVWAPNAERVSVIGDFNRWDPGRHLLSSRGGSGIWEGFLPGVGRGDVYKYRIISHHEGYQMDKADPFAFFAERPPATGSVVWELEHEWQDGDWMATRSERNARTAPLSIYELHLGSWRRVPEEGHRPLTYRELAEPLADHVERMGFTHVELLPIMEHPFFGSWGYQTTGYFAPTSRFGTPDDFAYLVDYLHRRGIGVILDWVPSHFPTDAHGLGYFDGTHLFEHSDPRQGFHPDWRSFIFNYDRHEVRSFLLSSALFWLDRYHVDGLRVDAVASMLYLDYSRKEGEWIPNRYGGRENLGAIELLRRLNTEVYRLHPDVQTIAEESTAWPMVSQPVHLGGLGFGMKWDMGWMHDTLSYFSKDPVHRKHHHHELTFRLVYAFSESFVLPLSHDEVVHGKGSLLGKMPGDEWQRFANLRLLYAYMYAQAGKKLLFMGDEFGQQREWDHDSSLDWHLLQSPAHRGVERLVADLNRLYKDHAALHELDLEAGGFEWIDAADSEQSVLTFLRRGRDPDDVVLVACNFTPVPREGYRVGVPAGGSWEPMLDTDAETYGGSGWGNVHAVEAARTPRHGRPYSVLLSLPPLGALFLRRRPG